MHHKISLGVLFLLCGIQVNAQLELPTIFSDNMVLQRNASTNFWGWAYPAEEVKIVASWAPNDTLKTKGNAHGKWKLKVPTPAGPGPYTIVVTASKTFELKNVMVGEVWVASGQSNMEWSADAGITNAEEAMANAKNAKIRFFDVPRRSSENPQEYVNAKWVESSPETMKYFSAVAYFFGKKLHEELNVPIGLIGSNWGGTPAEVWISEEPFEEDEALREGATLLEPRDWWPIEPGSLYNAMIHPFVPYSIAGVIWYQGETNTSNPQHYEHTFSTLIKNWRQQWDSDFPFYYAQIAPYNYGEGVAGVEVRDAQRKVLALPKTGMVMTSDIGNIEDIHPRNKLDVGLRFANLALVNHYKTKNGTVNGPLIEKTTQTKKGVLLNFKNSEGLEFRNKGNSELFEVAGEDGAFKVAKAKITREGILLKTKIENPKWVRYAWGNTIESDLFNNAGLPASSFKVEVEKDQ